MSSAQKTPSTSPFPSVRRVVTGHTPTGKSTILRDAIQAPQFWFPGSNNAIHDLHRTEVTPAVIDSEISQGDWVDEIAQHPGPPGLISRGGSTFRTVDYAPGSASPFHRTLSLDYCILTKGSVVLELDDGERVTLNEGDTMIQRGGMHRWRNETNEWARMYCVMLDAQPVDVNGETLAEEWRLVPSPNSAPTQTAVTAVDKKTPTASAQKTASKSPFPSVRRVVTGHTPTGKSTILRDAIQAPQLWFPGSTRAVHDLHRTKETPAVIDSEISQGEWVDEIAQHPGPSGLISRGGSTFRTLDYAPGSASPLHRTVSLDYVIVTKGSIVLELDDGERVTLKEGDTIIQRSGRHRWRNETNEWARMYCIMLDAQPVNVNGGTLAEEWRRP